MGDLTYYTVDLETGAIEKQEALSPLDLEITLANGDCADSYAKAVRLSDRIKRAQNDTVRALFPDNGDN